MSAVSLHLPPRISSTTALATQFVDGAAPSWAFSQYVYSLHKSAPLSTRAARTEAQVFRLPNSNAAVRDWLYTRPDVDAVGEDAFRNAAAESSTIFRMHPARPDDPFVEISPTVSNHWLMVPVQSINGVTVGLAYLDVLYQRPGDDLRVPPLPVGKFAIEDATGEVFVTGWGDSDIMIVGWIQSIIKCERKRELLMFVAPALNGLAPEILLRRNSFYERRDCHLCGVGRSIFELPEPCSGVGRTLSDDPTKPAPLLNLATLYRRFRGAYFGFCVKTSYYEREVTGRIIVPVFIDVRQGLYLVKQRFKANLQLNVDFSLDCQNDGLFGLNPFSSSRLFILKSSEPVTSHAINWDSPSDGKHKASSEACVETSKMKVGSNSALTDLDLNSSRASSERSASPATRRRRRVGVDDIDRDTLEFERIRRNRIAAEKSNKQRKLRLQKEKEELEKLKEYKMELEARQHQLRVENYVLRLEASKNQVMIWDDLEDQGAG